MNKEQFMEAYRADTMYACAQKAMTCFDRQHPSLVYLNASLGNGVGEAWLTALLAHINEMCGTTRKLDTMQMRHLVKMIMIEFGFLTTAELLLFAYRLESGRYGQFYGTIDPQLIMVHLRNSFIPERYYALEELEQAKHDREREESTRKAVSYEHVEELRRKGKLANI